MSIHGYEPQLKKISRRIDDLRNIEYAVRKRLNGIVSRQRYLEQELLKLRQEFKNYKEIFNSRKRRK